MMCCWRMLLRSWRRREGATALAAAEVCHRPGLQRACCLAHGAATGGIGRRGSLGHMTACLACDVPSLHLVLFDWRSATVQML